MIKKAILIILAVATAAAGIFWVVRARRPSASEAKLDFCSSLKNYGEMVASLRSIGQNSTVEELKEAQRAVEQRWDELQEAAIILKDARLDDLQASYADLEDAIQNISTDTELETLRQDIYLAALNILANTLAADQSSCKLNLISLRKNAELP